jgi:transposase-like protein
MELSRRIFTREMKLAAVQRLETGSTIAEVARAFEVNPNVLHRWRRSARGQATLFRVSESGAGMTRSKPSWNGRSASKRWRSIF